MSVEESSCVQPCVDVNSANVFALMAVRGIDQELAANIVDYRERKGPFHALEDLLKVKNKEFYFIIKKCIVHIKPTI